MLKGGIKSFSWRCVVQSDNRAWRRCLQRHRLVCCVVLMLLVCYIVHSLLRGVGLLERCGSPYHVAATRWPASATDALALWLAVNSYQSVWLEYCVACSVADSQCCAECALSVCGRGTGLYSVAYYCISTFNYIIVGRIAEAKSAFPLSLFVSVNS